MGYAFVYQLNHDICNKLVRSIMIYVFFPIPGHCLKQIPHIQLKFIDSGIFTCTASVVHHLSRLIGKLTISIGENKDADQLRGNHEADQGLFFRYSVSTILLPLK